MFNPFEYPNLAREGHTPRSPKSIKYNCVAWAAGDHRRWWCPTLGYYWPEGVPRGNTVEAFVQAFESIGYVACPNAECAAPPYEQGLERVAIYVLSGIPKHMARQIDATKWTSKMGKEH